MNVSIANQSIRVVFTRPSIFVGTAGTVTSVNTKTGDVVLTQDDIGDGTTYKQYSQTEKTKLAGIEAGAQVNNISNINATDLTDGGDTTLHTHDSRYYTETETNTLLNNKIDLNGQNSTVNYFNFVPISQPAYQEGRVWYDTNFKTLVLWDNFGDVPIKVGKQLVLQVRNQTGVTIPKGSYVSISGATGQYPTVTLARADDLSTSQVIGLVTSNITNNSLGKVITQGLAVGFNTGSYNDGDRLYLSATNAGQAVTTPPASPNNVVFLGTVAYANNTNGKILFGPLRPVANNNALGTSQTAPASQNSIKTYIDNKVSGASGTFTSQDGKTITVSNGLITSIV